MKEYIEKEKAVGIAHGYCHTTDGRCCGPDDVVDLYEELKAIPAADVVEVRRGRWIIDRAFGNDVLSGEQMVICSVCHKGIFWGKQNHCPNCGAKMDGGVNDGT